MPIAKITIFDSNGIEHELSGDVAFKASSDYSTSVACDNDTATLGMVSWPNKWEQMLEYFLSHGSYVATINGRAPSADGAFWIHQDRCMSVLPKANITATQITDEGYTQQTYGQGVEIYDTCPACRTCDYVFNLKKRAEALKIMFNTLKDVAIVEKSSTPANDALIKRRKYLEANQIGVPEGCTVDASALNDLDISMRLMLNEYVTTVHMWNYVVSQNNCSTEIHPTEESATGFYVQTKHALTSCDGNQKINCTILVQPADVESGLSMLVVGQYTKFMPFSGNNEIGPDMVEIDHVSATTKRVRTTFSDARAAGTYMLRVKFIPFIYVTLTAEGGGTIPLDQINWDATITPGTNDTEVIRIGSTLSTVEPLNQARVEDYNAANRYPSRSVQGRNIWHITVTWTINDISGQPYAETNTYLFQAGKCRRPIDGLIRNSEWVAIE